MMLRGMGDGPMDFQSDAGAFANYGPVVLFDGTAISDPANTPATAAQCLPYSCGVDPLNDATRFWCGYWGQNGFGSAKSCASPDCAPYKSHVPACNIVAPDPVAPAPVVPPTIVPPTLTPINIVQPLPDITQANSPVQIAESGGCFCSINKAINEHPVVALLVLAGAAALLLPKRGR